MKKRIFLVLLLVFFVTGCTTETKSDGDEHIKVLTSFYPMYLLAQEVIKDVEGIDLYNMAQPQTGCLHDYTLTTEDMQKLQEADILLINGGGMESFLAQAIEQFPDLLVVDTSRDIHLLETEHIHHHEQKEEHEHDHEGETIQHDDIAGCEEQECGNSHIWLSLSRVQKQTWNLAEGLMEVMPGQKQKISDNAESLIHEQTKLQNQAETMHHENVNVAVFHEGFEYLTELFHMNAQVQIFVDDNEQPSAKKLAAAVDDINNQNIQFYLVADDAGKKYAEVLAKECGGQVIVLDPITSNITNGETYVSAMENNIRTIKEVIEGGQNNES